MSSKRHILFVTGTRAELGLMLPTLDAIKAHPQLKLSVIATGMHLDPRAGPKLSALKAADIKPAAIIPWPRRDDPRELAEITGLATARLARIYRELSADFVLIVGDRVEAFAAASAAHIARIPLAHIHGGDRAEGQVDDALRHAITQLAHLHFTASKDASDRILRLGQNPKSVHLVGAPGVESIRNQAASPSEIQKHFPHIETSALVLLHPTSPNPQTEQTRATQILTALKKSSLTHTLLLTPNNDPGAQGIHNAWKKQFQFSASNVQCLQDLPRPLFLGLLRDCRLLVGNSSAGIIEAASFGTPVLNIGPRQTGRFCGENVTSIPYGQSHILKALHFILQKSRPKSGKNPYERPNTATRIAHLLATSVLAFPAPPKLLAH